MKRLCVFYDTPSRKSAKHYKGKPIEWIVCKKCQKTLAKGGQVHSSLSEPFSKYAE